jgi:hypothetical protein
MFSMAYSGIRDHSDKIVARRVICAPVSTRRDHADHEPLVAVDDQRSLCIAALR